MSGANRGIIRGESVLVYLEAEAILARIGPDPDGPDHLQTLAEALGRVCKHAGCTRSTRARGLCENHYRKTQRIPRDVVLEEVTHLTEAGTPPEAIATALHAKPGTLARSLYRAGRPDLANPIERLRRTA